MCDRYETAVAGEGQPKGQGSYSDCSVSMSWEVPPEYHCYENSTRPTHYVVPSPEEPAPYPDTGTWGGVAPAMPTGSPISMIGGAGGNRHERLL